MTPAAAHKAGVQNQPNGTPSTPAASEEAAEVTDIHKLTGQRIDELSGSRNPGSVHVSLALGSGADTRGDDGQNGAGTPAMRRCSTSGVAGEGEGGSGSSSSKWGASWSEQVQVLASRCVRVRRFSSLSTQHVAEVLVPAVLAGLFWFQLGGPPGAALSKQNILDLSGLIFFTVSGPGVHAASPQWSCSGCSWLSEAGCTDVETGLLLHALAWRCIPFLPSTQPA
jgi:hypothetical protein